MELREACVAVQLACSAQRLTKQEHAILDEAFDVIQARLHRADELEAAVEAAD